MSKPFDKMNDKNFDTLIKNELLEFAKNGPTPMHSIDEKGQVIWANEAILKLLGYSESEHLGMHLKDFHVDKNVVKCVLEMFAQKKELHGFSAKLRCKDGSIKDVEINSHTFKYNDLSVTFCFTRYVTEYKRAEDELLKAKKAADDANSAKSAFLANMSHEIRTPMSGVLGMARILLESNLDKGTRERVEAIHRAGTRLLDIVNDILDLSKIESGKMQLEIIDFSLREVVEEVIQLLSPVVRKKGILLADIIESAVPKMVAGDPVRLRQILTNLVNNAVKFTSQGAVIVRVQVETAADGTAVGKFSVTDSGIGITAEEMGRIFEPFDQGDSSTTRKFGGTGLGLTISRNLVELMKGKIGVDSPKDGGCRFWFEIPFVSSFEASKVKMAFSSPESLQGKRCVIFSKNAWLREILGEQLALAGIVTKSFAKIGGATAAVKKGDADFVMLDWEKGGNQTLFKVLADQKVPFLYLAQSGDLFDDAGSDVVLKTLAQNGLYCAAAKLFEKSAQKQDGGAEIVRLARHSRMHAAEEARAAAATGQGQILLVEDNEVNREVAVQMLQILGHRPDIACNGLEALAAVQKKTYNVIFMDCQMPGMDGFEATTKIRSLEQANSKTPIIAMTAGVLKGDREKCIAIGMNDYLAKPVSLETLTDVLSRWYQNAGEPQHRGSRGRKEEQPKAPNKDLVIDHAVIGRLATLDQGNGDSFVRHIVKMFLERTPALINALARAAMSGDLKSYVHNAHQLKGSSANIGAQRMMNYAANLELSGKAGEMGSVETIRQDLNERLAEIKKEFENVRTDI